MALAAMEALSLALVAGLRSLAQPWVGYQRVLRCRPALEEEVADALHWSGCWLMCQMCLRLLPLAGATLPLLQA